MVVPSELVMGAVVARWDFNGGRSTGEVMPGLKAEVTSFQKLGTFSAGGLTPIGTVSDRWRTGTFKNAVYNFNNGISLAFRYNGPVSFHVTQFDFSYANSANLAKRWVRVDYQLNSQPKEFLVESSRTTTSFGTNQMPMDEWLHTGDVLEFYFYFRRNVAGAAVSMDLDAIKIYGTEVPEPSSALILGGLGILASGLYVRRRRAIGT
jgi:hypothetical protein